jgi:hypothetical protein
VFCIAGGLLAANKVSAHRGSDDQNNATTLLRQDQSEAEKEAEHEAEKAQLAERKMKFCENRERVINQIMSHIIRRGERQIAVFNKIADRVEAFAGSHTKPTNYDSLLADVNSKKDAAQAALDAIKAEGSFNCSEDNPRGAALAFKSEAKTEIKALKDYKTAIKNLIVAVKSAQSGSDNSEQESQ